MDASSRLNASRRAVAVAGRRRPLAVDAALAAGLAGLLAVAVTSAAELEHDVGRTAGAVAVAVTAAPLVWRRRAPLVVLAWTSLISLAVLLGFGVTGGEALVLVAAATVVTRCPARQAAVAVGLLSCATAAAMLSAPGGDLESLLAVLGTLAATVGAAAAWRLWREKAVVTAGRDAAREREREQRVWLAVAAERARISREVHDVVAHHVTVMVSLADGAQVAAETDPARAATAMHQVSTTGRQALTELRSVLTVLKQDASGPRAPAGLVSVEELLATVRSAGLQAELTVSGAVRTLSAQEHATIHRIVQEALTNVLRHARDVRTAQVRITYSAGETVLDVTDDGATTEAAAEGRGLAGMRERAAVHGGDLTVGPRAGGGWHVRLRLPDARDRTRQ